VHKIVIIIIIIKIKIKIIIVIIFGRKNINMKNGITINVVTKEFVN